MTFYLKYRPQSVEELDLTSVRDQLKKIIASRDKPHAFLFCGPRGAGKTSTARILAKAVNCENPTKDGESCNKCALCVGITKGNCLDVIEMDAASHRGVEDVRSLRETIKLSPAGAKMKVYIIDEAHMLTTEAANALLKTLEEPPAHAMFILATTAPEKLLDTIRSRSTTINFPKGTESEIVRALQKVVEGEGLTAGIEVLEAIAQYADGSFREAHKLLEQLSLGSKEIKLNEVNKICTSFGRSPEKLIKLLAIKDVKQGIEEIESLVQEGVNLKAYATQLISALRLELLAKLGLGEEKKYGLGVGELKALLELFSGAIPKISTSVIAQLPLELTVVEWCVGGEVKDSEPTHKQP
ncbi:MAG: DNA polymerase III subunit gamma/tau, partial [bacterium]|nr:DNA polymerase III subunit gamma/tau [bacterium]